MIRTVTIVVVENGIELKRVSGIPMPSFVSVEWAIDWMSQIYIPGMKKQYPEIAEELNALTFEADNSHPEYNQQVQDEKGNWILTMAVKTNLKWGTVHLVSTDGKNSVNYNYTDVPMMDSWDTLPSALANKYIQMQSEASGYTITLADRANNAQITRSNGSAAATVYVDVSGTPNDNATISGDVYLYDYDVCMANHTNQADMWYSGRALPARGYLTGTEVQAILDEYSKSYCYGLKLKQAPFGSSQIDMTQTPPRVDIYFQYVDRG